MVGGWNWFGHSGGLLGYVSRTVTLPDHDLSVSIMCNTADGWSGFWVDGAINILRTFAANGPPSRRVSGWKGRWWFASGAIDLVPMGDKIVAGWPGMGNPFLDSTEIEVTGRDSGRVALANGYASHGEKVRRDTQRRGPDRRALDRRQPLRVAGPGRRRADAALRRATTQGWPPLIRIGILGAGAMGATHAAAYAGMADVQVAGVFGRDAERARSVAALCRAEPVTDIAALIQDRAVDAIDVCLPTALHHTVVILALDQGKHVFCETPLALRLDEARQMLQAARRAERLLQVGLLMRSVGAYEHIKGVASSGEHGRLLSLATWRLGSYLRPGAADHKTHYSDPSTELMTFDFDFVQWLMGSPMRLSANATCTAGGAPGEISALLAYDDGRHATIAASGLMPRGFPFSVGFRALFERAAFELRTVFEDGPPRSTSRSSPTRPRLDPFRRRIGIPMKPSYDASSIASAAERIRRFSMPSGPSRR